METIANGSQMSPRGARWEIRYDSDIRAVRACAMPSLSTAEIPEFCSRVRAFSRQMKCSRVIVDYSKTPNAPHSLEHADPALDAPTDEVARKAEIAFVFDTLDSGRIQAGRALRERGFNVAVFADEWDAIEWLN